MNSGGVIQFIAAGFGVVTAALIGAWVTQRQRKQEDAAHFMDALLDDNKNLREENARLREELEDNRRRSRTERTERARRRAEDD